MPSNSTAYHEGKLTPGAEVFETELWLPKNREEIFQFFANAENLQAITPSWLNFQIVTPCPIRMGAGALIDYRLKVRGIRLRWRTRIAAWEPPGFFVDEQLKGPYRLWVHEHRFEPLDGGTLVKDKVQFRVPGGKLMSWLFVRRDIERIFSYRREQLLLHFS